MQHVPTVTVAEMSIMDIVIIHKNPLAVILMGCCGWIFFYQS